jgi:hypothetical protein
MGRGWRPPKVKAYSPRSPELAASIERMRARSWIEPAATAFEQGITPTRPAGQVSAKPIIKSSSRFLPRQRKKVFSDKERTQRRDRKRKLGGSSALPDTMRHYYSEGERAVLCVVSFEVKRHGICDLSIDEIADRAGVRRTTVQNAMHEARRLCHFHITERPRRGEKSLTNLITIISAEWRAWIKRAPSSGGPIGSKIPKIRAP